MTRCRRSKISKQDREDREIVRLFVRNALNQAQKLHRRPDSSRLTSIMNRENVMDMQVRDQIEYYMATEIQGEGLLQSIKSSHYCVNSSRSKIKYHEPQTRDARKSLYPELGIRQTHPSLSAVPRRTTSIHHLHCSCQHRAPLKPHISTFHLRSPSPPARPPHETTHSSSSQPPTSQSTPSSSPSPSHSPH